MQTVPTASDTPSHCLLRFRFAFGRDFGCGEILGFMDFFGTIIGSAHALETHGCEVVVGSPRPAKAFPLRGSVRHEEK